MAMNKRYYLEYQGMKKEVSKKEWVQAERSAGFRPKCYHGRNETCECEATGGFSSSQGIRGSVEYEKEKV
jgi:hypothetical protein